MDARPGPRYNGAMLVTQGSPSFLGGIAVLLTALGGMACGAVQRPDGGEGLLPVGARVPALEASDQHGAPLSLLAPGQPWLLVYFYPKDGTPGCTEEACAIRDVWQRFEAAGVRVVGVSTDDAESHRAFAAEHRLPFSLVADSGRRWAMAFGVGRILGVLTERVSFLVGPDGKVARVYADVDPGVHAAEVLADVETLGQRHAGRERAHAVRDAGTPRAQPQGAAVSPR